MGKHLFSVEVRDEEGNIEALHRLPAQNKERLCSLGKESGEFVNKNVLNLIRLLDTDGDSNRISGRLDKAGVLLARCKSETDAYLHFLIFVSAYVQPVDS